MNIDPKLLERPKANGLAKRDTSSSILTMIKMGIASVFDNKVMKVKMEDNQLQTSLDKLSSLISQLNVNQKNMQVGKNNLTTQTVGEFKVNNLEELNLENVEKLGLALEQLEPIITSLKKGNQLDQQSISILAKIVNNLVTLNSQIGGLKPKDFPVQEITSRLEAIQTAISSLKLTVPKSDFKIPEFPKEISLNEGVKIVSTLEKLLKSIEALPKKFPEMDFPNQIEVTNFPPQKYPMPVTHISMNALGGFLKSRNITVTTSLTPLPDEVLDQRRSLVLFNNSSATTVFIGGSDVTATNGVPVPAQTYSPAIDAGEAMIVYGIVSTGSADVRVLELSDINVGR